MRRVVTRWISAIVLAVALALTVAATILWPRSYAMSDVFAVRPADQRLAGIISNRGAVSIAWVSERLDGRVVWLTRRADQRLDVGVLGFGWFRDGKRTVVSVPHWLVIPLAAL